MDGKNMKRKNLICNLRKVGQWPNGSIVWDSNDNVEIAYKRYEGGPWDIITCSQSDARLIAKRINQFIDNGG